MQRPHLPSLDQRQRARTVYGEDPIGYEAGRPDYPERVFEIVTERCGLRRGATVLEIGPGTGRATRRLVDQGATVTAVEPDPALAAYLREQAPSVEVRCATFEDVPLPDATFDLVVAAMSFHWVDQDIALPKLGRVLRPGGWAAVWWTLFDDPRHPDAFTEANSDLLGNGPRTDDTRPPFELDTEGWHHVLAADAGLVETGSDVITWTATFDPAQVRAFYGSLMAVRRRPPEERERLLDELAERARARFGGAVERHFATALHTGRKPPSS